MENLIGDLRMVLDPTRPKIFLKSLRPYCPRRERPRNPPSRRRKGFQVNKSKMLRLLSSPVLLLVVGCSTHVASLRYKPTEKLVVRAKRIQPVTIGNFADNRGTDPYLLGAIRGGVGIDLKKILADKPVSELVRAAFVEALAARKITEATATSRVAIEGTIVKLDCSYLFNREAHVQLQVNVLSLPARTVIFSKFYGTDNEESGRGAGILGDTDHLTQFQQRTLNETIDKVMIDRAFLAVLTKPPID